MVGRCATCRILLRFTDFILSNEVAYGLDTGMYSRVVLRGKNTVPSGTLNKRVSAWRAAQSRCNGVVRQKRT